MIAARAQKTQVGCGMDVLNTVSPLHSKDVPLSDPPGLTYVWTPLPEYLQPLLEDVADDLPLLQREELAAAIYEFRDVFSSGPTDMERTGLIKRTIDTGDQCPVRLPPRCLSIAKLEIEREEVQKMLDRGVIEPKQLGQSSGPCD